MLIQTLLKRPPGTLITLGRTAYQFLANDAGDLVCEVSDPDHIARLLAIPEGYRQYPQAPAAPAAAPPEAPAPDPDYSKSELIAMWTEQFGEPPPSRASKARLRMDLGLNP